jgi:2-amino-4-hydroxy-6-hydroxymethyldihydropteridine diphosphokinase
MHLHNVFIGLGGNIGYSVAVINSALLHIAALPGVQDLKMSSFYRTAPVSDLPQADYVNAVCNFKTTMNPEELFKHLEKIEILHGKAAKPKNAPRILDIDLLFFDSIRYTSDNLEIPHPRWKERLFVLIPLYDLTTTITVPDSAGDGQTIDLNQLIRNFRPDEIQTISLLQSQTSEEKCIKSL